jgi:hypothetical protein
MSPLVCKANHFTALVQVVLHQVVAADLLTRAPAVSSLAEAGKHLLSAASVLDFMRGKVVDGEWNPQSFKRRQSPPVLLSAKVLSGLAQLFSGSAQAVAAVKALSNESSSATFKARLCTSVVTSMNRAFETLSCVAWSPPSYATSSSGVNSLTAHIAAKRELFTCVTYLFLAQASGESAETGLAVAYCHAAKV